LQIYNILEKELKKFEETFWLLFAIHKISAILYVEQKTRKEK
jgi:hypothetical protein